MFHPTLYKRTATGRTQRWLVEQEGAKYRTHSGQVGGETVIAEWTVAEPKNVGRANETTAEQQATLEVEANYTKKRNQGKYFDNIKEIDEETYFSPMLAEKFDPERLDGSYYNQPKLNGVRCIAKADGLWSRKGKQFVNCPHISDALKSFFERFPSAILDGELYNHDYKSDFEKLASAIKKLKPTPETQALAAEVVQLHLYDFPSYPGNFGERMYALEEHFEEDKVIRLTKTYRASDLKTAQALHERNKAQGYEGSIVRLDAPYENRRTYSLMKYKDFKDEEFLVLDIKEGKGNWSGVAKIATLKLKKPTPDGRTTFDAGIKGDKEYCRRLLENKEDIIGKEATVVYFDLSAYGVPLFPIFQAIRDYE